MADFEKELEAAINKYSMENGSDTPDFILAEFLSGCLAAFNVASHRRDNWGNRPASERSRCIAARVWCDQDMRTVVMDVDAAEEIARIIDRVLEKQGPQPVETAP